MLHQPIDNLDTTVTQAYSPGAGTLTLADASALVGVDPTAPIWLSLFRGTTPLTILEITGISGNTLTVAGPASGWSDVSLRVGDQALVTPNAEYFRELQDALTAHTSNTSNPHSVTATQVGAYSTTQADSLLAAKASTAALTAHTSNTSNPHAVTAAQTGAYSTAQVDSALASKADSTELAAHEADQTNPHAVTAAQTGAYSTAQTDSLLAAKADASALSSLSANNLVSGTVPNARLGTGTPTGSTFLRGDHTWSALGAGDIPDLSSTYATTSALASHTSNTSNPHSVTAAQVGAYTAAQTDSLLGSKADSSALTAHTSNTSNPHSVTADQVLPAQTGNSGKYLTTDGTTASWGTVAAGGGSAAGAAGAVQLSDGAGGFTSDAGLVFAGGALTTTNIDISNQSFFIGGGTHAAFGASAQCLAIGYNATCGDSATITSVVIGANASCSAGLEGATAIGAHASVSGSKATSIGWYASGAGTAIGAGATSTGAFSVSIGTSIYATNDYSICIGSGVSDTGYGAINIGHYVSGAGISMGYGSNCVSALGEFCTNAAVYASPGSATSFVAYGNVNWNTDRRLWQIKGEWVAGYSDTAYKGAVSLCAYDGAGTSWNSREGLRVSTDGSNPLLSFFSNPPVAKPTVTGSRSDGTALASLLTALAALGLITDSSTA